MPGDRIPHSTLPPAEIGTAQQEFPVAKQAVLVQYQQDWPGNPGWWRYSRPVLRHMHVAELPDVTDSVRVQYVSGCREARRLQKEWDKKYPD